MNIGSIVRYNTGDVRTLHDSDAHDYALGRVVHLKTIEDSHGSRRWIGVCWYDDNGTPSKDSVEHAAAELVVVRGATDLQLVRPAPPTPPPAAP